MELNVIDISANKSVERVHDNSPRKTRREKSAAVCFRRWDNSPKICRRDNSPKIFCPDDSPQIFHPDNYFLGLSFFFLQECRKFFLVWIIFRTWEFSTLKKKGSSLKNDLNPDEFSTIWTGIPGHRKILKCMDDCGKFIRVQIIFRTWFFFLECGEFFQVQIILQTSKNFRHYTLKKRKK